MVCLHPMFGTRIHVKHDFVTKWRHHFHSVFHTLQENKSACLNHQSIHSLSLHLLHHSISNTGQSIFVYLRFVQPCWMYVTLYTLHISPFKFEKHFIYTTRNLPYLYDLPIHPCTCCILSSVILDNQYFVILSLPNQVKCVTCLLHVALHPLHTFCSVLRWTSYKLHEACPSIHTSIH